MDSSERMMSPNPQKSLHSTTESKWEVETSPTKFFPHNELSDLIRYQVRNGYAVFKAVDVKGYCFYCRKFPQVGMEKLKCGIFAINEIYRFYQGYGCSIIEVSKSLCIIL